MNISEKRQAILDYIIQNNGSIKGISYKEIGIDYLQGVYNHLKSLEARGFLIKVGMNKYSILKERYSDEVRLEDIKNELIRLRAIERKYNQILNICTI